MRRLTVLTNSAERAFRSCQRLYFYQYEELYRPIVVSEPLAVGTLQHAALEAWWKAAKQGACEACGGTGSEVHVPAICANESDLEQRSCSACGGDPKQDWLRAALDVLSAEPDPYRRATAEALMVGYHHRWSAMKWEGAPYDGATIEVLGAEVEFEGPLLNPKTGSPSKSWARGGKLDVLVRVRTSPNDTECPVWVVEHKTTSSDFGPGTPYRAALRLDTQVSGYHVGGRFLAARVDGVLYDVIGKPGQKPLKATPPEKRKYTKATAREPSRLYAGQREADETPEEFQGRVIESIACAQDEYFARFEVVRLEEEERLAAQDTWQYGEMIRDARRLKRWPRNPSACHAPGRTCAFLPVCEGTSTLADGTRYRRAESAHEELCGGEERKAA